MTPASAHSQAAADGPESQQAEQQQSDEPEKKIIHWDDGLWIETLGFETRTKIGGTVQLDSAAFVPYPSLEDLVGEVKNGVEWRRARVDATGTLGRRWGFKFRWDFAVNDPPNFKDAWMELRFIRYPIRLRAGRFSSTFGLENQSSSNVTGIAARYGQAFELGGPERLLHVGGDYARRWVGDDLARVTARPESNL